MSKHNEFGDEKEMGNGGMRQLRHSAHMGEKRGRQEKSNGDLREGKKLNIDRVGKCQQLCLHFRN